MIVYFSGTGNSKFCAEFLAKELKDEMVDGFNMIKKGELADLNSSKPWIFVAPTYAWQLPRIFADFIRKSKFTGTVEAYFVMTCGDGIGNAQSKIRELCREKNLVYNGVMQVIMPENYIAMFKVPDKDTSKKIIQASKTVLAEGVFCIKRNEPFPEKKASIIGRLESGPINKVFYKAFVKAKAFYATDKCNSCGKCVTACPLNNIRLAEGKPVWKNNCTHCMACICGCPTKAIEYGNKTKNRNRYLCQDNV